MAVVKNGDNVEGAEFYCWQHRDQAVSRDDDVIGERDAERGGRRKEVLELRKQGSIDTMVQKLGLEDEKAEKKNRVPRPPRRTETKDFAQASLGAQTDDKPARRRPAQKKKPGFWASLCCMSGGADDDYVEIVRRKQRVQSSPPAPLMSSRPSPVTRPQGTRRQSHASVPVRRPISGDLPLRPKPPSRSPSNPETSSLLSLLPPNLPPTTTSALLAELVKPISLHDEEGYIYIFWLIPQSNQTPDEATARSLLSPPQPEVGRRRVSDVMSEYSVPRGSSTRSPSEPGRKTIMLKIGRANNVTRRMNEWQRQCGYSLTLIRWYPHIPSSARNSPHPSPTNSRRPSAARLSDAGLVKKVPYVKRVERLIHLELQDQRVKKEECEVCGKEHREWFAVKASADGVKAVDEVVRRWVEWAEREAEKGG